MQWTRRRKTSRDSPLFSPPFSFCFCFGLSPALRGNEVLLEGTLVLLLLRRGLEGTVTELGGGIDPLELDVLEGLPGGVDEHRLAEGHDSLLDTGNGALEHDEVVVDLTIADEATKTEKKGHQC